MIYLSHPWDYEPGTWKRVRNLKKEMAVYGYYKRLKNMPMPKKTEKEKRDIALTMSALYNKKESAK